MNLAENPVARVGMPDRHSLGLAVLAGVGYALLIYVSSILAGASVSAFPVWLSDGFALGFWYITRGYVRWPQLLTLFLSSLLYAHFIGSAPVVSYSISLINTLQLAGGAAVLAFVRERHGINWNGMPRFVGLIVGVTFLVNGICAALCAGLFHLLGMAVFADEFVKFFISDGLGILIVAPLMGAWLSRDEDHLDPLTPLRRIELVAMLLALIATSYLTFTMRPDAFGLVAPLFYLVVPFVLWGAVRFGLRGATLALAVCSLMAVYYTMQNLGPFVSGFVPTQQAIVHLQGFLTVLAVSTLLASALMLERRAAMAETLELEHRYDAAIKASDNLVFEIRFPEKTFTWAGDVPAVLGWHASDIDTAEAWTTRIHPDDRARVVAVRDGLLEGRIPSVNLEYRIAHPDGHYALIGVAAYGRTVMGRRGIIPRKRAIVGFEKTSPPSGAKKRRA